MMQVVKVEKKRHCDECVDTEAAVLVRLAGAEARLCAECLVKLSLATEEMCHEVVPSP